MKNVIFIIAIGFVLSCSAQKNSLQIPAKQVVQLDYPQYALWVAALNNKTMAGIEIAVISKSNNDTIRGFGLGVKAKANVMVERDAYLCLINPNNQTVELHIGVSEEDPIILEKPAENTYRSFTLRNNSATSIPLIIPGVMNPNLSPYSNSGVDLKIGQEILFKYKGKKQVLLVVDENITNGDKLDVAELMKARKAELDAR